MRIKQPGLLLLATALSFSAWAQSTEEQLQKASSLQKQFKEEEALVVYKQVLTSEPNNTTALVKCTELNTSIGKRLTDKITQAKHFAEAKDCADKAMAASPDNADALYAEALSFANLSTIEQENKKVVEDVKQLKLYADKGLAVNPNHALLNYMEGKWHLEMTDLNWLKKAAIKTLYGEGLAKPDIDSAVYYLEKTRKLSPYFVQNYVDLAKAYRLKNKPADEIDVLTVLVKLPNRTADDASLKEAAKKRLAELQ